MENIRIRSTGHPFETRRIARLATRPLTTASAMGLLGDMEVVRLDMQTLRRMVDRTARAGIGTEIRLGLGEEGDPEPADLEQLLERWSVALEESPAPEYEWRSLEGLFGADQLSDLLHVSVASVRRYSSGQRQTPDLIADRLHFLATVIADLAGTYNDYGIRRWFQRSRTQLDGQSPAELLGEDWSSDSAEAKRVRELARSLGASSAT